MTVREFIRQEFCNKTDQLEEALRRIREANQ